MAPSVTAEYLVALRALIAGDEQAFAQASDYLQARDGQASQDVFAVLQSAALVLAAPRRFADGYTNPEVLTFVASARSGIAGTDVDIAPRAAERMLKAVLGSDDGSPTLGDGAEAGVIPVLLIALLDDLRLSRQALDEFLREAGSMAQGWTRDAANHKHHGNAGQ
jgi:hypothetical protein